jgi:hypothetical protein
MSSPRKASRPPSRRTSRAPSVQPGAAAPSSRPASRAGSRAPSIGPSSGLVPTAAENGRTSSRRSSRAPSLGPNLPSDPPVAAYVQEEIVEEEVTIATTKATGPFGGSPGRTFAPPEGDSSLFTLGEENDDDEFNQAFGQTHGSGMYPSLDQDHTFGL